jgi:hypothetical protein
MYRTDIQARQTPDQVSPALASMIGVASAPSWKGPYRLASPYGGAISAPDYPYEENEDPFVYKNRHGWHALFHANTWGDSHGKVFPVPEHAGRHAFSLDGQNWTYSPAPPYTGTIPFGNGTTTKLARMERPWLVFKDDGSMTPEHLFTGVQTYPWDDYTWTLHLPLA